MNKKQYSEKEAMKNLIVIGFSESDAREYLRLLKLDYCNKLEKDYE